MEVENLCDAIHDALQTVRLDYKKENLPHGVLICLDSDSEDLISMILSSTGGTRWADGQMPEKEGIYVILANVLEENGVNTEKCLNIAAALVELV